MFTQFDVFLAFVAVNLVLAGMVILFVHTMTNKVIQKVTAVYELVQKGENERKRIRRNGIIARVLRQLSKELTFGEWVGTMNYGSELTTLSLRGVDVGLVVDDARDSSERGQLCALIQGYPTIESCTDDLKYFVREILRVIERENDRREREALANPADDPTVSLAEIGAPVDRI